jgi:hypothetical protein
MKGETKNTMLNFTVMIDQGITLNFSGLSVSPREMDDMKGWQVSVRKDALSSLVRENMSCKLGFSKKRTEQGRVDRITRHDGHLTFLVEGAKETSQLL